jgi:hypothetical protein
MDKREGRKTKREERKVDICRLYSAVLADWDRGWSTFQGQQESEVFISYCFKKDMGRHISK